MLNLEEISYKAEKKTIFHKFSYTFPSNSITPIVGPSGCGKTTLIRIAAGLLKPLGGTVSLQLDEQTRTITGPSEHILVMNQTYTNFPWVNCLENVLFSLRFTGGRTQESEQKAADILAQVGLGNYLSHYPASLSGGMKQRLALARVLFSSAPVIVMDEPLSALDRTTRTKMQQSLLEYQAAKGNTILVITHDTDEAELLKKNAPILTLKRG